MAPRNMTSSSNGASTEIVKAPMTVWVSPSNSFSSKSSRGSHCTSTLNVGITVKTSAVESSRGLTAIELKRLLRNLNNFVTCMNRSMAAAERNMPAAIASISCALMTGFSISASTLENILGLNEPLIIS